MAVLQAIIARLQNEAAGADGEICGALIGMSGVVYDVVPLANQSAPQHSSYRIAAVDVLRLEQQAESSNAELIGFYHSHPNGSGRPSRSDLEQAFPGYIYLIIGGDGRVAAWRLRDDRSGFDEVRGMLEQQPADPA